MQEAGERMLNERVARLEVQLDNLREDLDRNTSSVEKLAGSVEKFNSTFAGGKAIWWFIGLVFAGVLGAATLGDKISSLFHMTGK